ncbi:glycerophosphodiester phosphodiesterase [Leifsonia bigeumensis]|uniref:Glycerophosphodiester phosphodiesterase n=1 Tax=Leifsonella bigeumensis TaxID=433643 RepID=A0ABP7FQK5_9MICO
MLAHRGLALAAPENTLLAFAKALAAGVEFIETDVHESADGIAIVSHDPDLTRVAGREVRVDQLTAAELRRIDLGSGQGFSTLAEALDGFPDARFNIDVKSAGAVLPTVDAIRAQGATERVLVTSFSESRRRATVRALPGVATSASFGTGARVLAASKLRLAGRVRRILRSVDAVQLPERWKGVRVITPPLVRMAHSAGVEVHVWTVNDPAEMHRLLDLGVDGIVTDRADLAAQVLRSRA